MVKEADKLDKIDLLYKNLDHVMHATYAAEGAFPYWETVFALILGQLIIAYFQPKAAQILISIIGLALSAFWYVLVNLNYIHSKYRTDNIRQLEDNLAIEYQNLKDESKSAIWCNLRFLPEDIPRQERAELLSKKAIISELLFFTQIMKKREMLSSTWFYRKMLPFLAIILLGALFLIALGWPIDCPHWRTALEANLLLKIPVRPGCAGVFLD